MALVHPSHLDEHPCRVWVSRRGLGIRRLPARPSRTAPASRALLIPWWALEGLSADGTRPGPGGGTLQVLEIVTDAGTLTLLGSAPSVSSLLGHVARRSARWRRARRPWRAAVSRRVVLVGSAAVALVGRVAASVRSAGGATRWVATGFARRGAALVVPVWCGLRYSGPGNFCARLCAASGHALSAGWWAAGRLAVSGLSWVAAGLGVLALPLVVLLAPLGRAVTRATAPARARVGSSALAAAFRSRPPGHRKGGPAVRPSLMGALAVMVAASGVLVLSGAYPVASGAPGAGGSSTTPGVPDTSSMARMIGGLGDSSTQPADLPPASAPPVAAPPSLADAAPLHSHEVFGFAPYWTLGQSAGFDVNGLTTIAYFSVGVNPDGSLDESDSGWAGYESQDLADLVTRAHAAGSRVVLTVNCFDQGALDQLTSSPTAPATLSSALIAAVTAKNLDGVNLDFEGAGSGDQAGLTHLVSTVSAALKGVNPHYQVTMDTYASSAGDPTGFYDIPALAPAVDGFFVMAYQLNLEAKASSQSPLTSTMFSDLTTVAQYTAAAPASKVILGVPYYGYDWPTSDGTLNAQATGGATPVAYSQIVAAGHPRYWDPVTDTGWTSYLVGGQWHEAFYEDPASLYMEAELAQFFHIAGLGIWALGFDGNDPAMLGALLGFAPASKGTLAGPTATPPSVTQPPAATATTTTAAPAAAAAPIPTAPPSSDGTTTTTSTAPTTSTTSPPTTTTTTASLSYSGVWQGQRLALTLLAQGQVPTGTPLHVGQLTGFQTNDPALACLAAEPGLGVWQFPGNSGQDVVMTQTPSDCTTADFSFAVPSPGKVGGANGEGSGSTVGPGPAAAAGATPKT